VIVKGPAALGLPAEPRRCPTCRTKIVVPGEQGLMVRNSILRVSAESGHASAKCPRCKTWVEVPLTYRE
jgi:phage FluMu protein Com